MSQLSIYHNLVYSYLINNETSQISYAPADPFIINIISDSNILFTLSPADIYNVKWKELLKLNVSVTNLSQSVISSFNIKLNEVNNLSYVGGTLVNSHTGVYYPCIDWENNYCITDSIAPGATLNLNYFLTPLPDSNHESYIISPFDAYNSTETPSTHTTNNAYIHLSEQKIVITPNTTGNLVFIENRGTITSAPFTYKYLPPTDLVFSGAFLLGIPYLDIQSLKLGSYYVFKIGPLPVSTPNDLKPLTLIFS